MAPKLQILVLISGSGTNLQAIIDSAAAKSSPHIDAQISTVISSSPSAYGLTRAKNAHIPTIVHDLQQYYQDIPKDDKEGRKRVRKQFNVDLAQKVLDIAPDLIVCAGWMLILSPSFLNPIAAKGITIINLHPALPGQFDGINAIERAWEAGQRGEITKSGVMIHRVIKEVDQGQPLVVKELDLRKDETLKEYEDRVHAAEHIAIVEATILALNEVKQHKSYDIAS
ncbi:formyl transferase [Lipomyces kononenkoae]|uniref:Formyl transferase n=1 Tax=Lipomyces kononenkoae TaxID=34357 RepID=A0ACC3T348_LIPKO